MSKKSAKAYLASLVVMVILSLHSTAAAASLELMLSSDVTDDGVRLEEEESKPIGFNYTLKVSGDSNHTLALAVCATVDNPDIAVATVSQEAIVPLHADVTGAFNVTVRGLFLGRAFLHVHFVVGHGGVRCGQPEAEGLQELLRVSENGKDREVAWNITRTSSHPQLSSSHSSPSPSPYLSTSLSSSSLSSQSSSTRYSQSSSFSAFSSLSSSSVHTRIGKPSFSVTSSSSLPRSSPSLRLSSSSLSTSPPTASGSSSSSSPSSSSYFSSSTSKSRSPPNYPSSSVSNYSSDSSLSSSPNSSFSSSNYPSSSLSNYSSDSSPSSSPNSSFSSPPLSSSSPSSSSYSSFSHSPSISGSSQLSSSSSPRTFSASAPRVPSPTTFSAYTTASSSSSSVLGVHSGRRYPVVVIRKEKPVDVLFMVVTVVLVFVINVGMGSELEVDVVKATLRRPFAPITGVVSQFVIMPLVAFGVTQAFELEPGVALGFFALGCSPGGSVSNSFCYLLGGDVSLSITMTFISTLAAIGMVPFWLYTLGRYVSSEANIKVPFQNIILSLLGLVLTVSIGLLLKVKKPRWAKISVIISKVTLGIFLVFMLTVGIYANLYIFSLMSPRVLAGAAVLPYTGFLLGGLVAILLRFSRKHVVTIAVETGIQNSGIAILLMLLSLDHPDSDLSIVGPVASSIFTPLPLWIAVITVKLRQRFCKKSDSTDDSEATGPPRGANNISGGATTSPVPPSTATTTSLWKKLFGKGDGGVSAGGTKASGDCICGNLCGLADDEVEDGGGRKRKEESAGRVSELTVQGDTRSSFTDGRPPSSVFANKRVGGRSDSVSGYEGGYDNPVLRRDEVDRSVLDPDKAAHGPEFSGGTAEDPGSRPTAVASSESLYDVISVKSDMSTATAITAASTVRSEKRLSTKVSKHSSSSSFSRSPKSEEGEGSKKRGSNEDETDI